MKTRFIAVAVLLAAILPSMAFAGALHNALLHWDSVGIYGTVTSIEKDILIIKEQKVMLINDRLGTKRYVTSVMDINGEAISSADIKNGVFVVVKGSGAYDHASRSDVIVAKEIYILPREMTEAELSKYPLLNEPAGKW